MKTRLIIALSSLALLVSCNDIVTYKTELEDLTRNNGAPSISAIYDIYDSELENPLDEGALDQLIHITGENLASPVKITFNGIEADLSNCYSEIRDSYVVIPRELPTQVNNKLVYETSSGSTTFDFGVGIPQLALEGLANEFAWPGSTVKVNGDYFDLFGFGAEGSEAKIMMGSTPVEIASVSEDGMSIVIPEDAADNSILTFSWEDLTLGPQTKNIPYRRTDCLIYGDLADIGYWSEALKAKHLTDGTADGDPESLGYSFLHFNTPVTAWDWYSMGMGGALLVAYNWEAEMDNLVFKCELWTNPAVPIPAYTSGGLIVQFNTKANIALDLGGSPINTGGEWKTFSWPLSSVASEMPEKDAYMNFAFTIQPPVDWTVDFAFANPRIEPVNY